MMKMSILHFALKYNTPASAKKLLPVEEMLKHLGVVPESIFDKEYGELDVYPLDRLKQVFYALGYINRY